MNAILKSGGSIIGGLLGLTMVVYWICMLLGIIFLIGRFIFWAFSYV